MKIAIYTRKSKYSDKSESIDSQIEYCKQTAKLRYPDVDEYVLYVDEGFSGGSTVRPQYQKMLLDIKRCKDYVAMICYKIDRISRSLADFTTLQQELEKANVHIISASEGFDTSSTWGVAVLNILMIFAQLERSNISERIKDTMLHYAKMGRWTGGLTPLGFESKSIPYDDAFGQEKNMVVLSPVENEIAIVKTIFDKYLELQSLNAVSRYLNQHGISTRKGKLFDVSSVRDIIRNPVYATADKDLYDFFREVGAEVCNEEAEFDGNFSVISYNRMDKKTDTRRPMDEWLIAISRHSGTVTGQAWVRAQRIIKTQSGTMPRLGTAQYGIFSGLIKCAKCGSTMRVKNGRPFSGKSGREHYYVCFRKESSKLQLCDMKNIIGHKIEPIIIDRLVEYARDTGLQNELAKANKIKRSTDMVDKQELLNRLKNDVTEKSAAIRNLVMLASKSDDLTANKYLLDQISSLDNELSGINQRIAVLELELTDTKTKEMDMLSLLQIFENMENISQITDIATKRRIMKSIIRDIQWDGKTLEINFKAGQIVNFNKLAKGGDFFIGKLQTFQNYSLGLYPNKWSGFKGNGLVVLAEQIRPDNKITTMAAEKGSLRVKEVHCLYIADNAPGRIPEGKVIFEGVLYAHIPETVAELAGLFVYNMDSFNLRLFHSNRGCFCRRTDYVSHAMLVSA
ncbi:MAG: recombinase family protein [Defluviitaleaceae bacterium]|nr:recombinase family protein [Defluviitaleaceae bacterium]